MPTLTTTRSTSRRCLTRLRALAQLSGKDSAGLARRSQKPSQIPRNLSLRVKRAGATVLVKVSPTSTPMRLLWRAVQPRREKALTGTAARSLRRRCRRPQSPPFRQPQRRAIPQRHGATTRRMCKQVVFFLLVFVNLYRRRRKRTKAETSQNQVCLNCSTEHHVMPFPAQFVPRAPGADSRRSSCLFRTPRHP